MGKTHECGIRRREDSPHPYGREDQPLSFPRVRGVPMWASVFKRKIASPLRGRGVLGAASPALKRWANIRCAYGAFGLEPVVEGDGFAARVNSCPDTRLHSGGFFSRL